MASLQRVCRICERQKDLYDFTVQANAEAANKLATLTSIRIRADDSLPRHICGKCCRKLHKAYKFRQQCEVAEQKWQEKTISVIEQESVDTEEIFDFAQWSGVVGQIWQESNIPVIEQEPVDTEEGQQSLNRIASPTTHSTMENLAESEMHMVEDRWDMVLEEAETAKRTTTHGNRKHYFICKYCDQSFEKAMELFKHDALSHSKGRSKPKERNFPCQDCHKSFTTSGNLTAHVKRVHRGEKRFVCDTCGKAFNQKVHLEEHRIAHVQEKNYPCVICEKRFKSQKHLNAHLAKHSERVKCDICGKLFSTNQTLNTHKRLHNVPKPFGCTVCDKAFVDKPRFKRHMRQVHGKRAGKKVIDFDGFE